MKSPDRPQIRIPKEALDELEEVEKKGWAEGITIASLINWINAVEDEYRPDDHDGRSSKHFTERSFRHYQTLGCIDPPRREGKIGKYGFRQYLQALLIRKLIWQRVPSEQIAVLMKDKSNEEYKLMLFEGVEIIAQPPSISNNPMPVQRAPETWNRHLVGNGIELHINSGRGEIKNDELPLLLSEIERILYKK